jgi:hypothetical protein
MEYVHLHRTVVVNGVTERRKESVPCLNDESGAEAALKHWTEFRDAWDSTRLHLPSAGDQVGPMRFKYFKETLKGTALQLWNQALTITEGRLEADFWTILQEFWKYYIPEDAVNKELEYLTDPSTRKPYNLKVRAFNARLTQINWYLSWTDGIRGDGLPLSEDQLKNILYNKMIPRWKDNFISSGRKSSRSTRQEIVEYMEDQEDRLSTSGSGPPSRHVSTRGRGHRYQAGRQQRRNQPYSPRGLNPARSYYGGSPRPGSFSTYTPPSAGSTPSRPQMQSPATPRHIGFTPSSAGRFSSRGRGGFQSPRGRGPGRNPSSFASSPYSGQGRSGYVTPARNTPGTYAVESVQQQWYPEAMMEDHGYYGPGVEEQMEYEQEQLEPPEQEVHWADDFYQDEQEAPAEY